MLRTLVNCKAWFIGSYCQFLCFKINSVGGIEPTTGGEGQQFMEPFPICSLSPGPCSYWHCNQLAGASTNVGAGVLVVPAVGTLLPGVPTQLSLSLEAQHQGKTYSVLVRCQGGTHQAVVAKDCMQSLVWPGGLLEAEWVEVRGVLGEIHQCPLLVLLQIKYKVKTQS